MVGRWVGQSVGVSAGYSREEGQDKQGVADGVAGDRRDTTGEWQTTRTGQKCTELHWPQAAGQSVMQAGGSGRDPGPAAFTGAIDCFADEGRSRKDVRAEL